MDKKLKEPYVDAKLEISNISFSDVITTSGTNGDLSKEEWGSNSSSSGWT